MKKQLRIALAQINVTVGDLEGNAAKIADFLAQATRAHADLVLFPELCVTGYPPEDLLFKSSFVRGNLNVLRRLMPLTKGTMAIVGFADRDRKNNLYNAAALLHHGRLRASYHKMVLPNYGVFDEKRYFQPGKQPLVLAGGTGPGAVGVSICEDIWVDDGPIPDEAAAGATVLLNLSASPYHAGKLKEREKLLSQRARANGCWICYTNLVGGQDELVFDGGSLVVNPRGRIHFRAPQFTEGLFLVEIPLGVRHRRDSVSDTVLTARVSWKATRRKVKLSRSAPVLDVETQVFHALVLGTRDYVQKNGFSRVVVGLSGGIDSALTAAIAVAALGKKTVTGVSMPSRYSSSATQADARAVARNLGIHFLELPIEPVFQAAQRCLAGAFRGRPTDATEENLQARIRGLLLMALSNKFQWLVLATGNKSELSTGYCTLYGDMVGGFAVIKDVPKTWVYRIARVANRFLGRDVIPPSVFTRAPTAELKPHQKDQDTLPPYRHLDSIIRAYVECDQSASEIHKRLNLPRAMLNDVIHRIDANEYKRRQAPIGIKITPRAFGKDRRMPVTNRHRDN